MANVDQCVRWAEEGLCGNEAECATKIAALPEAEKVKIFHEKSGTEVEGLLRKFRQDIIGELQREYNVATAKAVQLVPSSNNNRVGADVVGFVDGVARVNIEVKFGSKTDHAMGAEKFREFFGIDPYSLAVSRERRCEWRNNYVEEWRRGLGDDAQRLRLTEALNMATKEFNSYMSANNYVLPALGADSMERYLLNNSGADNDGLDYMLFDAHPKKLRMERQEIRPTGRGIWKVQSKDVGLIGTGKRRIDIVLVNEETKIAIKFVFNFKNSYKIHVDGETIKAAAKLGLGSPSWNVWVKPLKSKKLR